MRVIFVIIVIFVDFIFGYAFILKQRCTYVACKILCATI